MKETGDCERAWRKTITTLRHGRQMPRTLETSIGESASASLASTLSQNFVDTRDRLSCPSPISSLCSLAVIGYSTFLRAFCYVDKFWYGERFPCHTILATFVAQLAIGLMQAKNYLAHFLDSNETRGISVVRTSCIGSDDNLSRAWLCWLFASVLLTTIRRMSASVVCAAL